MIEIKQETLTRGQAIELFRELGSPIKDYEWDNYVTRGHIVPANSKGPLKRFARADIIELIEQKKKLARLLTPKQVLARIREHLPSFQYSSQITRIIDSGRIKPSPDANGDHLFEPRDVDELVPLLIEEEKTRLAADSLMTSKEAWNWINARLAAEGREERIDIRLFYHWADPNNGKIPIDRKVPGKNGIFQSWRFSEESLLKAPIFNVAPEMPEVEEVVDVVSTKQIPEIEAQWGGELVTKRGVQQGGILSLHAISKKGRKVYPVANLGNNILFPVQYIPLKQRRKPKEEIDLD